MGGPTTVQSSKPGGAPKRIDDDRPPVQWPGQSFRDGDVIDFKPGPLPSDVAGLPVGISVFVVDHADRTKFDVTKIEQVAGIMGKGEAQADGSVKFVVDQSTPPASNSVELALWQDRSGPWKAKPAPPRSRFPKGIWRVGFAVNGKRVKFFFRGDSSGATTDLIQLPLIEDDDDPRVLLALSVTGVDTANLVQVQAIRDAGVVSVRGSHTITDGSKLELDRRFMVITGQAMDSKTATSAAKDQFGRTLEFAIPVNAYEEVTADVGTIAEEETTEATGAVALTDTAVARRAIPIVEIAPGALKVQWAKPLRELMRGDLKGERLRWALELLDGAGKAFKPRRFLEPAHRWRNMEAFRIAWETPVSRDTATDDTDGAGVKNANTPPNVATSSVNLAALVPALAKGKPAGRAAVRMNNADKFHHLFRVLAGKKAVALSVRTEKPTIRTIGASQVGVVTSGLSEAGAITGINKDLPYAAATRRPDGGDWQVRDYMRHGYHQIYGPARRGMNTGTRFRNHWCGGLGPWLHFNLAREPWGPSFPFTAGGKFRASAGSVTARNTGKLQEWGGATGRLANPKVADLKTWPANTEGNAIIRITNSHYETILEITNQADDPSKWEVNTIQGNTGNSVIPKDTKPLPTKRDEEGVTISYVSASLVFDKVDKMDREKDGPAPAGGGDPPKVNSFDDAPSWVELQGLDGLPDLRSKVTLDGTAVKPATGDERFIVKYEAFSAPAGSTIVVRLDGTSLTGLALSKFDVVTSPPGGVSATSVYDGPTLASGKVPTGFTRRGAAPAGSLVLVEMKLKKAFKGDVWLRFTGIMKYQNHVFLTLS